MNQQLLALCKATLLSEDIAKTYFRCVFIIDTQELVSEAMSEDRTRPLLMIPT